MKHKNCIYYILFLYLLYPIQSIYIYIYTLCIYYVYMYIYMYISMKHLKDV